MSDEAFEGQRPSTHIEDYSTNQLSPLELQKVRKIIAASDSATLLWIIGKSVALWFTAVITAVAAYFTIPWPWRKG